MAAHILCHTNEILPNTYPPPRPSPKDHGMVSEYEPSILMSRRYPQSNSGISVELDGDITPALRHPTPTFSQCYDPSEFCDPALCVTPEKSSRPIKHLNKDSGEGTNVKQRNSQKVRFDSFVEVKCVSPNCSPSQDMKDSPKQALENVNPGSSREQSNASIDSQQQPFYHSENNQSNSCEPIVVLASDIKDSYECEKHSHTRKEQTDKDMAYVLQEMSEHVLARPEFNSTLKVGKVVKEMEEAELDIAAAIKERLKQSSRLKSIITEKVTGRVNARSHQFQGLVSVEPCDEDLISAIEKQKKVKPAMKNNKAEKNITSAPDILEYLMPDLLHETASLSLSGLPPDENGPKTADLSKAFDVYRHIRTWQGW